MYNRALLVIHDKLHSWCTYWYFGGNIIQPVKAKNSKKGHLQNNISRNKTKDNKDEDTCHCNGNLMVLVKKQ